MTTLLGCLLTASAMLTAACCFSGLVLRHFRISTLWLRQTFLFCALLQGLMLVRLPVELPWLDRPTSSVQVVTTDHSIGDGAFDRSGDAASAAELPVAIRTSRVETPIGSSFGRGSLAAVTRNNGPAIQIESILLVGWIGGALLLFAVNLRRYLILCRSVDRLPLAPEGWFLQWARLCKDRSQDPPEMLVSQTVGPMLVRRPNGYALIVPERFWAELSKEERQGVLLHEWAHLRRRDVWRQLFVRMIAMVHWWNPIVWWTVRKYEESCEWACDQSLAMVDPRAAKGLASSLIRLVEFLDISVDSQIPVTQSVGVQSMAAPPLTQRVTRLLQSPANGDSLMKRWLVVTLSTILLILSAVQFRLVAADADESDAAEQSKLRVVSAEAREQLDEIRRRLNTNDKTSRELQELLLTETGQIAFAGVIDQLQSQYRSDMRSEAISRFFEQHFETNSENKLVLRESSHDVAESWKQRSKQLGGALESIQSKMKSIAERLDDSGEVERIARRMLTDESAAFAIMLENFDGRSDPIDLFIDKALQKILVKRGDKFVVIPTLGREGQTQIKRFEMAQEIFQRLRVELPSFATEFATTDPQHQRIVKAMATESMAAILSLHAAEDAPRSPTSTADELFNKLEEVSRDTADGLVIDNKEAMDQVLELVEYAERASRRVSDVRARLVRIAETLDWSDPLTARFATQAKSGVIAYQVAAEIPYADFDLGKQVEGMLSEALESADADRLKIRADAAEQVSESAGELLKACRTIRRYLRRIAATCQRFEDQQLAQQLDGHGHAMLLSEIKRFSEEIQVDAIELLSKELFVVDAATNQLTVRPDRATAVGQLARRAEALKQELSNDDF